MESSSNYELDQSVSLLELMGAHDSGVVLPPPYQSPPYQRVEDSLLDMGSTSHGTTYLRGLESSFGNLTLQQQLQMNTSLDQYPLPNLGVAPSPMPAPAPARNYPIHREEIRLQAQIVGLAVNYQTSDFLQELMEKLKLKDQDQWELIYKSILEYLEKVMTDEYGCEVFRKMLGLCNSSEIEKVVLGIQRWPNGIIVQVANNQYGKECLEELVGKIKRNQSLIQLFLALILESDYIKIFTNPNGCSVIKHCLTNFDYRMSRNLYTILEIKYSELAPRSHAYMLIMVGMAKSRSPHRESLLNLAAVNSLYLSMHQFGNFILQYAIKNGGSTILDVVCNNLEAFYDQVAMDKHGSHVMEVLLNTPKMEEIVIQLLYLDCMLTLAQDQYGNYVVQGLLKKIQGNSALGQRVCTALDTLSGTTYFNQYGRNVQKELKKLRARAGRLRL